MRLKQLRKTRGKTQADIAKILNVAISTYRGYENETSEPTIDTLIKLANYFNVSVDYLIGNETSKQINQLQQLYSEKQKNCIDMLMQLDDDLLNLAEVYLSGLCGRADTFTLRKIK